MAIINVNSETGSDVLGTGSSLSPFKTINRAVVQATPGDVVLVHGEDGHIHTEPDSVEIVDKLNIKIQTTPLARISIRPEAVSKAATFVISQSDDITISGFVFESALVNAANGNLADTHKHAILIQNSSDVKINGTEISQNWQCHNVAATELYKCINSYVSLTGNFCNYISNSYPALNSNNFLSFISLAGNGSYKLKNNAVKNVHSNSSYAYGIKIYPDCGEFEIDDFEAAEFTDEHVDYHDKMIGIYVSFDNSPPNFSIRNATLKGLGYGLYFDNATRASKIEIKKLLITHCKFAGIMLDNSSVIHSTRGITIAKCHQGIYAKKDSSAVIHNTIIYGCQEGMRSEESAVISLKHCVYFKNATSRVQNNKGLIDLSQFTRNIDPRFVNAANENYALTDYSPCVDTGYLFQDDDYLGSGPDIGYLEKSSLITEDDLPALLARATRLTESVPLTDMDTIGMISKGIETSDGNVLASREGSAIKDLAVKPLDLLLKPYLTELELVRSRLSFENISELSEEDADLLASNMFVYRNTGNRASGIIRIYFSEPTDSIIYAEHEFKTKSNLKFYNRATVAVTKDEMALNYDNGAYYFDILADSAEADPSYNVPAYVVSVSTMPMPPGTLSFTNPFEFSGGNSAESNYALREKTRHSITVRDLVTKKGIQGTLPEMFPAISGMRTIGYRDPEMERDYVASIVDHIGGKSDIYIKTHEPVKDSKIIYPKSKRFEINNATFSGYVPILSIDSIEILEPISEAETGIYLTRFTDYKISVLDSWVRFSAKEKLEIEFADEIVSDYFPNTPLKINFTWVPEIKAIQAVVDGDSERVVCADLLVKAFEPTFVSFAISYLAEEEIVGLEGAMRGFVRGLPAGSELQVSDLISLAYMLGANKVFQPMELESERHARDGELITENSPDGITIPRISCFWDGDISTHYMGQERKNALYGQGAS